MQIPGIANIAVTGPNFQRSFKNIPDNAVISFGKLKTPGKIQIRVELMQTIHAFAFVVDGQKNPRLLREGITPAGNRVVSKSIGIREDNNGIAYVGYPANHLRLGKITDEHIEIWELSVVTQNGFAGFFTQKTFDVKVERKLGGKLFLQQNRLKNWPQMMTFLEKILQEPLFPLAEADERQKSASNDSVLWWNIALGMGAIQTSRGAARAHWSSIVSEKRPMRYLIQGESVRYEITKLKKRDGDRPTTFTWEATNISPLQ